MTEPAKSQTARAPAGPQASLLAPLLGAGGLQTVEDATPLATRAANASLTSPAAPPHGSVFSQAAARLLSVLPEAQPLASLGGGRRVLGGGSEVAALARGLLGRSAGLMDPEEQTALFKSLIETIRNQSRTWDKDRREESLFGSDLPDLEAEAAVLQAMGDRSAETRTGKARSPLSLRRIRERLRDGSGGKADDDALDALTDAVLEMELIADVLEGGDVRFSATLMANGGDLTPERVRQATGIVPFADAAEAIAHGRRILATAARLNDLPFLERAARDLAQVLVRLGRADDEAAGVAEELRQEALAEAGGR